MKCRIADFNIEIKHRGGLIKRLCEKYLCDFDQADFILEASDEDILREKKLLGTGRKSYLEAVALARQLAYLLPGRDAFLLHAATFQVDDRTVALLAKSGTGKSTHMMLYKELFGKRLRVINGDKPIVRIIDGKPYAYGSPWCGKEGMSENVGAPLTDIGFINRSDENKTVYLAEKSEAAEKLLSQVLMPEGSENLLKILDLVDATAKNCSFWSIFCDTSLSSAEISSRTIFEVK